MAEPSSGRRVAFVARALLTTAFVLLVGACARETAGYYPQKGDVRPHPAVARAHKLPIHGIDVSRYQGKIDWASVRDAGTQFAFIKATEGGDYVDPRFSENWHGARRAGVPRGAYHFMYWCRPAHEQAAWFRRNVPADPEALPPVLDLEWNGHSRTCPFKASREAALEATKLMLEEMERHTGKRPIIYTDIPFHREVLEGELRDYPMWVRSTAAEPHERYSGHAGRRWTMWQYTTTGRVPGIQGDVDRNAFYGGEQEWAAFLATDCDPRHFRELNAQGVCNGASSWAQQTR
jgi:lysozyme